MNITTSADVLSCPATASGLARLFNAPRSRYVLLQSLVSIMLSYQLIYGEESIVGRPISEILVAGLMLVILAVVILPKVMLASTWLPSVLVTLNTIAVTATIYLSGNARTELYFSYFLLVLLAASARTLGQMLGLSLVVCAGYGVLLYESVLETGLLSVGHLMGIPVLLVMAVFYGVILESLTLERRVKTSLTRDVDKLRETEKVLLSTREQLESRVTGLRQDLSKANTEIQAGAIERQGLERQLRDAQKMEAFGRIAGGMAKEFGQLLTVVGSQTGVILSKLKPNDPLYQPVEDIFRAGERAAALTAQLVSLNLADNRLREPVPLHLIVSELQGLLEGLLPNNIDLRLDLDPKPAMVYADREQIELVLLHLVINARDAMPNGGHVVVETKQVKRPLSSTAMRETPSPTKMVRFTVSDTGRGITPEIQARMFEPFFSTKSAGVGLGLPTVYGIVRQLGGNLEVDSKPGHGTTFHIYLPQADSTSRVQQGEPNRAVMANGNETVLLVEQDELLRKFAASALARHKYQVLEAASPVEALLVAQQHTGSIHMAISQLVMPEINGHELSQRLVSQRPGMKALFVSGYSDEAMTHHRIRPQFVLQRPYRQDVLLRTVRDVLDAA